LADHEPTIWDRREKYGYERVDIVGFERRSEWPDKSTRTASHRESTFEVVLMPTSASDDSNGGIIEQLASAHP
jgi:hypothetical protein